MCFVMDKAFLDPSSPLLFSEPSSVRISDLDFDLPLVTRTHSSVCYYKIFFNIKSHYFILYTFTVVDGSKNFTYLKYY